MINQALQYLHDLNLSPKRRMIEMPESDQKEGIIAQFQKSHTARKAQTFVLTLLAICISAHFFYLGLSRNAHPHLMHFSGQNVRDFNILFGAEPLVIALAIFGIHHNRRKQTMRKLEEYIGDMSPADREQFFEINDELHKKGLSPFIPSKAESEPQPGALERRHLTKSPLSTGHQVFYDDASSSSMGMGPTAIARNQQLILEALQSNQSPNTIGHEIAEKTTLFSFETLSTAVNFIIEKTPDHKLLPLLVGPLLERGRKMLPNHQKRIEDLDRDITKSLPAPTLARASNKDALMLSNVLEKPLSPEEKGFEILERKRRMSAKTLGTIIAEIMLSDVEEATSSQIIATLYAYAQRYYNIDSIRSIEALIVSSHAPSLSWTAEVMRRANSPEMQLEIMDL